MTSDALQTRPALTGAAFSGLALLRRPGVLLGWTLVSLPFVVLVIAGVHVVLAQENAQPFSALLFMLAAIVWRGLLSVLSSAAYRARLRPEQGRFAYLRLGAAEWRVMLMGIGRNPGDIPMGVFVAMGAALVAMVLSVILIFSLLGGEAGVAAFALAWVAWIVTLMTVNARASLAGVAAFAGRPDPQTAGWELGRGRTLAMAAQGLGVAAIWLAFVLPPAILWWTFARPGTTPSGLWSPTLPVDGAGWALLALEIGAYGLALSLVQTLAVAFGSTAHAVTWQRLGGQDAANRRRSLFEA